jgi:hypothetical protein
MALLLTSHAPPPPPLPPWGGWGCHKFATPITNLTKWVLPMPSGPERRKKRGTGGIGRHCPSSSPPPTATDGPSWKDSTAHSNWTRCWWGDDGVMEPPPPPPRTAVNSGVGAHTPPPPLMAIGSLVRRCHRWHASGAGGGGHPHPSSSRPPQPAAAAVAVITRLTKDDPCAWEDQKFRACPPPAGRGYGGGLDAFN